MYKIICFFKRYSFFFVFLLLESIGLSIFLYYHKYQQSLFLEEIVTVRGGVNTFFSFFSDFIYLKIENERLLEENKRLRNEFLINFEKVPPAAIHKNDTIRIDSALYFRKYRLFTAKVVANHYSSSNNVFQILIGANHGIKKDMGVITREGVAGFVTNVSDNYAEVLSILNKSYKISALHKRSGFVGLIEWDGKNIHEMIMSHLPYTASVSLGDTICTSQYSEKLLPCSVIGTIIAIEKNDNKNSYNVRVKLAVDFSKIMYVYVIDNMIDKDLQKLTKESGFKNWEHVTKIY